MTNLLKKQFAYASVIKVAPEDLIGKANYREQLVAFNILCHNCKKSFWSI